MNHSIAALIAFVLFCASTAVSQSAPIAAPKVAVIDSEAFTKETGGIRAMTAALKKLQDEAKPRRDKLNELYRQREQLRSEIETLQKAPNPNQTQINEKADQGQRIVVNIKREEEDAQAFITRRMSQLLDPINTDLGKELRAFAKRKGIDIIIDVSKVQGVFLLNESADVTAAFIAEYNAKPQAPAAPGQ